jgi:UDP-2,4-diacetamido-2,4,6-trideoxy-beta-L-altropyranose hydrolase
VACGAALNAPLALFRCDASADIGAGHLTRCLALAETLVESGWSVAFAARPITAAMVPGMAAATFNFIELDAEPKDEPAVLSSSFPDGVDMLVVDHYGRDFTFERQCRDFARRILVLDDGTGRQHDCDLVVDAAACDCSLYRGRAPAHARFLLGPSYALVRRSFVTHRPTALACRNLAPVKSILISFGATDPWNATPVALAAVAAFADHVAITIAMSSRAAHLEHLRPRLPSNARLVLDADMARLMSEADLAVGAAGATAFERAVLGLPSVIVAAAENQRGLANLLTEAGAAIDCGSLDVEAVDHISAAAFALLNDAQARLRMSRAASDLIDGQGGARICDAVRQMDRALSA